MKKLKLEALEVTSFETSPTAARDGGTVHAHSAGTDPSFVPVLSGFEECATWSPADCPTDPDFCCTMGCTAQLCTDDTGGILIP